MNSRTSTLQKSTETRDEKGRCTGKPERTSKGGCSEAGELWRLSASHAMNGGFVSTSACES